MGARLSNLQDITNGTSNASESFRVLYKMDSEDAAVHLGNIRLIVGYDDLMIIHLLRQLDSSTKLGVKLLSELRRLEVETVITIRILNKRRLAARQDLFGLVKNMEDTCDSIRDFLFSLQVCVIHPQAGDAFHEKASTVLKAIGDRREDLLRLRITLFPKRPEVKSEVDGRQGCIQRFLTAITGRGRQDPARRTLMVTGVQTVTTSHLSVGEQDGTMLQVRHPAVLRERAPSLLDGFVRNAIIFETVTGRPAPQRRFRSELP